jgi:hypothetical protein
VLAAQLNYGTTRRPALWLDPGRVDEALALTPSTRAASRERMSRLTFAIHGFGKVGASFASRLRHEIGAAVTMVSDVSGTVLARPPHTERRALAISAPAAAPLGDAPPDVLEKAASSRPVIRSFRSPPW